MYKKKQRFWVFSGMGFCNSCGDTVGPFGVIFKTVRKLQHRTLANTHTPTPTYGNPNLPRYWINLNTLI